MFRRAQQRLIVPFVLPALGLLTVFFLYPLVRTFQISMSEYSRTGRATFVGAEQYGELLHDSQYLSAVQHALIMAFVGGAMLFPPAIAVAWAFHHRLRGETFFRMAIFSPVVLSVAVVALMWKFVMHPTLGLINPLFDRLGLGDIIPILLGNPHTALPAVTFVAVWHGIGVWIVLMSAGFSRLPTDVIEAARIDGCGEWRTFWHVMLPLMRDLLRVLVILWFVQSLQAFAFVFIMTSGGPFGSSEIPATLMFRTAFDQGDFGYAAAMGIVLVGLLLVVAGTLSRLLKRSNLEY
ncbi:sugar ABC transporter permease [Kribbella sp. NPDC003505]|uniref:carbohydrate ABC transporter permease n=1 Tax=Kribbella sp. NPDC003505 TaxID=3154448 RepID=UPI00339EB381